MTDEQATLQICALKARYFRLMDTTCWKDFESIFSPTVVVDMREATGRYDESQLTHGATTFVTNLAAILEHVVTVHHGHTPEIRIDTADRASGIWAMEDKLWVQAGSSLPFRWLHGYGHYHEHYVKLADGWRIQEMRLTRIRVDVG